MEKILCILVAFVLIVCHAEKDAERSKRATTVWSLHSVPSASNPDDVIKGFAPLHHQWGDDSISSSTSHGGTRSLKIHYKKGSYSTIHDRRGAGFYSKPHGIPSGSDAMILQYDVFFEHFGFGKGGKLPGLFGGESGEGGYKCSGGSNPSSCFNLRLMWRANGDGEIYAYIPSNQESGFADRDDVIANSAYGQSLGRGRIHFKNNKWQTITEEVHLNTAGHTNGWVKVCVKVEGESQQCYTATNLNIRNTNSHHIRGLCFSTFFGGSSSSYAAPNDCNTYFKNFKLLTTTHTVVG